MIFCVQRTICDKSHNLEIIKQGFLLNNTEIKNCFS